MSPPFVIFAHGRSGSTSLAHCLNAHPALRVAFEPFHPKFGARTPGEPSYVNAITDISSLDVQLDLLFARYSGIKVLDRHLPTPLYTHLLLKTDLRIVMLRRRNLLQAIVSGLVAAQTRVWQRSDMTSERAARYHDLAPLPLEQVEDRLRVQAALQRHYQGVVRERPEDSWHVVTTEDLYTRDVSRNRNRLAEIYHFLGLAMPRSDALDAYLDPPHAKITTQEVYARIPNGREIDARLGSDETGWLFEA